MRKEPMRKLAAETLAGMGYRAGTYSWEYLKCPPKDGQKRASRKVFLVVLAHNTEFTFNFPGSKTSRQYLLGELINKLPVIGPARPVPVEVRGAREIQLDIVDAIEKR